MTLQEALTKILGAIYGRDVRQAIHDGIKLANDAASGAVNTAKTNEGKLTQFYNDILASVKNDFLVKADISTGKLSDYTDSGSYYVVMGNSVSDLPSGIPSGFLFNIKGKSGRTIQYLTNFFNKDIQMRMIQNDGTVYPWEPIWSGSKSYFHRGDVSTGKLSTLTQLGSYFIHPANTVEDLPAEMTNGTLFVFGTASYPVQILVKPGAGQFAIRYVSAAGSAYPWFQFGPNSTSGSAGSSDLVVYGLGDSIESPAYSYLHVVAKLNGWSKFYNLAKSGATLVKPVADTTTSMFQDAINGNTFSDADYIILGAYSNDRHAGTPIGTASDTGTDTMCGMLKWGIQQLMAKKPSASIVMISDTNQSVQWYYDWRDASKSVAELYRIPFINMLDESPFNKLNYATLVPDGAHPSEAGHRLLGAYLAGKLPR